VLKLISHTKERIWTESENRVLRTILGPKREEVAGGWRNLQTEELYNMYAYHILLEKSSQGGLDG